MFCFKHKVVQMRKISILLVAIACFAIKLCAQQNNLVLISSAGDYFTGSEISMSWSLGEVLTEPLQGDGFLLFQGFQQGGDFNTSVPTRINKSLEFVMYPNPASTFFTIETIGDYDNIDLEITIHDISGRIVKNTTSKNALTDIDIRFLKSGTYFVRIKNNLHKNNQVLILEKVNY